MAHPFLIEPFPSSPPPAPTPITPITPTSDHHAQSELLNRSRARFFAERSEGGSSLEASFEPAPGKAAPSLASLALFAELFFAARSIGAGRLSVTALAFCTPSADTSARYTPNRSACLRSRACIRSASASFSPSATVISSFSPRALASPAAPPRRNPAAALDSRNAAPIARRATLLAPLATLLVASSVSSPNRLLIHRSHATRRIATSSTNTAINQGINIGHKGSTASRGGTPARSNSLAPAPSHKFNRRPPDRSAICVKSPSFAESVRNSLPRGTVAPVTTGLIRAPSRCGLTTAT